MLSIKPAIVNWRADSTAAWHALYTRCHHEKTIARILSNKGFEIFLPLYAATHRWKDRNKSLFLPLIPCYVFIRGGLDRRLLVLTTPGIHGFVGDNNRSWTIPDDEIEAVRRVVERSTRVEPYPFLRCGDRVRVRSGPLEGIEGILTRKKNICRLVLSVDLLEKSVAVEIDASLVERVADRNGERVKWAHPAHRPVRPCEVYPAC